MHLSMGWSNNDVLVFNFTRRTRPSLPGTASTTPAIGQQFSRRGIVLYVPVRIMPLLALLQEGQIFLRPLPSELVSHVLNLTPSSTAKDVFLSKGPWRQN